MGQPEELLPLMRPYMIVNMISLPFACWFNTFKQFFDGIGHTKTSMYIMIAGNILNIGGNYLLIYGPGPMPELGLLGAGISTMASRIIMFFAAAAIFLFTKKYKTYSSAMRNSRFSKELYRTIDKQSWPVALQMGMESSAFALTGVMAGWLGTTALATHQIMITISQLFFMVYYGITSAVSVRVSYYIGQNDVKQLRDVAAAGLHIVLLIGAIVVIPVLLLRNDMGYWFADSKEVAEMCAQVIILMVIYQFGDGMQMIYANALRGTGYVKPMMYIAFVSYFIISLPTSYFLGIYMNFGIVGIWTAFPICLTVAAVLYYYFFKKKVNSLTA
jgi:MATE family multidrug resistance protein